LRWACRRFSGREGTRSLEGMGPRCDGVKFGTLFSKLTPETQIPKPGTRDPTPKPETRTRIRGAVSSWMCPRHAQIRCASGFGIRIPNIETRNPKPGNRTRKPKIGKRSLYSESGGSHPGRFSGFERANSESLSRWALTTETRNPKPEAETRNPKPKPENRNK